MTDVKSPKFDFNVLDDVRSILIPALASIIILLVAALETVNNELPASANMPVHLVSIFGSIFILSQTTFILLKKKRNEVLYAWTNAILGGIGLGSFGFFADTDIFFLFVLLQALAGMSLSLLYKRGSAYFLILLSSGIYIAGTGWSAFERSGLLQVSSVVAPVVLIETIFQLKQVSQNHLKRLETINKFIQHINSTLETGELMITLNSAMQGALDADTYFIGLVNDGKISLPLFFDDGEYFENVTLDLEGSLSGWVVENQRPLFLRDLRSDLDLEGVQTVLVGKEKTSLSWMGVPMRTTHIDGVLALASYEVNAFDQADLELLSNLAQHTVLALENSFHHAQVEEQARVDSLTSVFNHRSFLEMLAQSLENAEQQGQSLSLIMLDIDYFKQYNDTYGHQLGDLVLTTLCDTIRKHIKNTDFIGRWGGEEFAIALPDANGLIAHKVAIRIQDSLRKIELSDTAHNAIPCPTLSQGISVFPDETRIIDQLIYIADQRLYIAKERGRNQIEPDPSLWEQIQSIKK